MYHWYAQEQLANGVMLRDPFLDYSTELNVKTQCDHIQYVYHIVQNV